MVLQPGLDLVDPDNDANPQRVVDVFNDLDQSASSTGENSQHFEEGEASVG